MVHLLFNLLFIHDNTSNMTKYIDLLHEVSNDGYLSKKLGNFNSFLI